MRKEQLTAFIDQVIAQGETIRQSAARGNIRESPGANWYPRIMSVFHVLGSRADPWKFAVAKCPTNSLPATTDKLLGVLRAIREAVNEGLVEEIEDTAHAEAFAALLAQARQLAEDGLVVAAGSVAQTVLHEHLREWCLRVDRLPQGKPSADELGAALHRHGHLTQAELQTVRSASAIGTHCQHNNQPLIAGAEIKKMLQRVGEFIASHPLP
jgi:hypothetical protein